MASDSILDLSYDEDGDVLYASLGSQQAALSYEVTKDVWLDYIPPSRVVVGMTMVNFLAYHPIKDRGQLLTAARAVVQRLLRQYPSVPPYGEMQATRIISEEGPYVQSFTSSVIGIGSDRSTIYVGGTSPIQSPQIQSSQV
jgi:hypothetical protein